MKKTLLILTAILLLFSGCSREMITELEKLEACKTEGIWEDKIIPYYLDHRYEGTEQHQLLLQAMGEFEALGFEFVRGHDLFDMPEDYLFIKWAGFARAPIGNTGGEQMVYLPAENPWNSFYSTTVHELGHKIGLEHTHKRADRDEYLDFHWENIKEGNESFFEASEDYYTGLDYYDIYSIMSYSCTYQSINGKPTMTLKDGSCFEPMETLSPGDIETINNMYCQ